MKTKILIKSAILSTFLLNLFCQIAQAVPGDLDPGFDGDGRVLTQIGGLQFTGNAVAVQTDGKILVAGTAGTLDFAVVRYNADGSLDTAFDTDGLVTTDIGGDYTEDEATAIAIQSNGKIIVAGYSYSPDTDFTDFTIVRYNTDGSLDTSFDTDGKTATAVTNRDDFAYSISIQTDGKILLGGRGRSDFAAVRYNPDGSLDAFFGAGGIVTIDVDDASTDTATSIAVQADGKILLAGYKRIGSNNDFAVVRLLSDGSDFDMTFDADGIVMTNLGADNDQAFSLAVQPDGKIVLAGTSGFFIALTRYNGNGSLDTSFDGDGIVSTNINPNSAFAKAVKIQSDGKIVAAGRVYNGKDAKFVVLRYQPNGSLDASWGTNGVVLTDFGFADDQANALAFQADGKIVAAGFANGNFAVARYFNSGALSCSAQLDLSFGECGKVVTDFAPGTYDAAFDVAAQPDGKIIVAGLIADQFGVARYNPDGSLDTSFDADGYATFPTGTCLTCRVRSVLLQTDGKIVAVGETPSLVNNGSDVLIVRFNGDGSLDTGYGNGGSVRHTATYFINQPNTAALQTDGKVVVLSFSFSTLGGETDVVLARFNTNGTADTSFGTNGVATSFHGSALMTDMALQPDGKIVTVGGSSQQKLDGIVVRYTSNGSFDNTFGGGDGYAFLNVDGTPGSTTSIFSVVSQADGKILVGGNFSRPDPSNPSDTFLARFNSTADFRAERLI